MHIEDLLFQVRKKIKMQERKEQFLKSRIILSFLRPKWPIFNLLAVLCVIQSFKRETCVVCVHLFWAKLLCYHFNSFINAQSRIITPYHRCKGDWCERELIIIELSRKFLNNGNDKLSNINLCVEKRFYKHDRS